MTAPVEAPVTPPTPASAGGAGDDATVTRARKRVPFWKNPWRKPYFLATGTWLYIAWSLVPVLIAIQFSFNDGRSRSTWQGFSTQWYCCADGSLWTDKSLVTSLENSLILAFLTVLVATPLGVLLALGLTRWRSKAAKASNGLALVPLVTPEIVLGAALYLVILNLYQGLPFGRTALLLGHVTFTLSFVLVIVRSRLLAIGPDYETAARDLGATPMQAIRTVLVPLLMPAVVASAAITFATSLDDFVVSSFLFGDASNMTVPVRLYSAVKAAPTPGLNALATVLLVGSVLALILAYLGLRLRKKGGRSALEELATFET